MNRQERTEIPEAAPRTFVKPKWMPFVFKDSGIDRCYYELCERLSVSGLVSEPTAPLFPTFSHHELTRLHLAQADVHSMIQRRAIKAGIETKLSCHSFRATGITTYLQNGGKLAIAQQMAGHESARTTGPDDRTV